MALPAGTLLGPYEILAPLGAGAMGEVYRARDTKLARDVALKLLPDLFAKDPDRLARFDREAKTLAALNHPQIAQIYGFEHSGHVRALVMELVEGEDFAQRIARGPIPLDEALAIAMQIAEALEAAHAHGIVHRDLKPANIKVRADGAVKVLDFGLAKAAVTDLVDDISHTPTFTAAGTAAGVILGTAAYMAPEQARGRAVDKRADVWAFGCVLYEMVTAKQPFAGETMTDVLAAIMQRDPDWSALPASTPVPVRRLLRRCLEKDAKHRLADLADARLELEDAVDALRHPTAETIDQHTWLLASRRRERAMWMAGALIAAALGAALTWWLRPMPANPGVVARLQHPLAEGQSFSGTGRRVVAISPDGTKLAYLANDQLFLRHLHQLDAQPLLGPTERRAEPVFSPDGNWIAYFAETVAGSGETDLRKIPVAGGAPVTLSRITGPIFGATWRGDLIVFGRNGGGVFAVQAIPDTGGPARTLVSVDGNTERAVQPELLEDRQHVLFGVPSPAATGRDTVSGEGPIVVQAIGATARKVLVPMGLQPRVLPTGHLVYVHDRTLFAVQFDAKRLEVTGGPVPVVEGISQRGHGSAGHFALSQNGTLVYARGSSLNDLLRLVVVDRKGNERPLLTTPNVYEQPRLSPDRTRLVMSAASQIWMWTFATETLMRLTTSEAATHWNPAWMNDRSIVFDSNDGSGIQIVRKAADGAGREDVIVPAPAGYPNIVTPDGRFLIYHTPARVAMLLPLQPRGEARPLLPATAAQVSDVDLSPDRRWIAFESNESGRFEIYVRPFPSVDAGRWQISSSGGQHPLWSRDGRELFFIAGDGSMMAVPIQHGSTFSHGRPARLFPAGHYSVDVARNYEVTPDGTGFIFVKGAVPEERQSIVVVPNWFEELRAKMRTARQ